MNGFQIVAHHVLILPLMVDQFDIMVIRIEVMFFFQNEFFVLRKYQYFSRIYNPVKIRKYSLKYFIFVLLHYNMKYFIFVLIHYNMKLTVVLQWNIDGWAWHLQRKIKKKLDRSQLGPSKVFGKQMSALKDRVFLLPYYY